MLERNRRVQISRHSSTSDKQPRQLLAALLLLLIALGVVIGKNRDFWFGTDLANSNSATPRMVPTATLGILPAHPVATPEPVAEPKSSIAKKLTEHKGASRTASAAAPSKMFAKPNAPVVAAKRTVLPPLEIEVIAGDSHRTVRYGSDKKVEMVGGSDRVTTKEMLLTAPANAAQHQRLQNASIPELRQTVDADYPLLGQHTSVQGSVVLQAVVGADGSIEDLRVLSGPAILSAAAQQAVRQWRFKPYLQNGQAVETKAKITVNFSIKISDSPSKASQGL